MLFWQALFFVMILLLSISVISLTSAQAYLEKKLLSPRQQIAYGISPENIVCADGLVLIKKLSHNSTACVKSQTAQKLVERGWKILSVSTTEQSNNSTILPNIIKVSNANFTIHYDITGGKITQIKQDTESKSFIILVQTTSDGKLTIKVPRVFYDAKMPNGNDDRFVILLDGQYVKYTETKTTTDRTVTIPFTQGTQEIEFIGTQILSGH